MYVRSLLLNGERKSIEPLAQRLPEGNVQAMQQFIWQSPWDWNPVWERLAKRMTSELSPDPAWVVDDTGLPKQGTHWVGVERQYSGTLGKTGNCQVAVSVHHVGEQENTPLGWRLYLPESWAKDAERHKEAGIPEELVFRKKWELAPDIIDQVRAWGLPDQVVLADAGYGDGTEFREELEKRGLAYAVGVTPQVGVWLKPPKINEPTPNTGDGRPPGKPVWLLVEWPESEQAPAKYSLCDLSAHYSLRRLVRLIKCRWKIEQDYHQLKEELGLYHYEGRNGQGWHHHVTMVILAHAFLTLETLRIKDNCGVNPAEDMP